MIAHFVQDNGFLNYFIEIAEQIAPGQNIYILLQTKGIKQKSSVFRIKHKNIIISSYPSPSLNQSLQDKGVTHVIIHFLSKPAWQFVHDNAESNYTFTWIFWGADYYSPYSLFTNELYDTRSLAYFQRYNTQTTLNNSFLNTLKRWYRRILGDYLERKDFPKKANAIRRINHFAHYNILDYETVSKRLGFNGDYIPFFYFEYDYKNVPFTNADKSTNFPKPFKIQIGNSASLSNNHLSALQAISSLSDETIEVLLPLSYGDKTYGKHVIHYANSIFPGKIHPMHDFIPKDEYLEYLSSIDIAIMNHIRAESAGNVFMLLAMGKPVFMNSRNNLMQFLLNIGIDVREINMLQGKTLQEVAAISKQINTELNRTAIINYFSYNNAVKNIKGLLDG